MIRLIFIPILASGLFYGLYCLTLRRDSWLQLSRVYLILMLAFSLVLPFIRLPQNVVPGIASTPMLQEFFGEEIIVSPDRTMENTLDAVPAVWMFGMLMAVGHLVFQLLSQVIHIAILRRRHEVYRSADGYPIPRWAKLILVPDDTAPFSFLNQIVVGCRDLDDNELRCILVHESFHVQQLHTVDVIVMRLMCCAAWFNPFAWLMLRELRAVHEYQADATSTDTCGREEYLHLLYRQATGIGYGHITNNFQSINLKNRIVMMNRTKTRYGAWKALTALPVAALLLLAGCKPTETKEKEFQPALPTSDVSFTITETADSVPADMQNAVAKVSTKSVMMTSTSSNGGPVADKETTETDPEFPGGMWELYKFMAENIHYPERAKKDGVQGRVFVRFVIDADGTVKEAEVLRGIGSGCDEEALRVVNAMPKWKPGTVDGKPVRTQYNLPITFKLGDK